MTESKKKVTKQKDGYIMGNVKRVTATKEVKENRNKYKKETLVKERKKERKESLFHL